MKIQVTQEDIDKGVRGNISWCPIALAVKRALDNTAIEIQPNKNPLFSYVNIYDSEYATRLKKQLPVEANNFALNFDRRELVEPFEFELDI